MYLSETLGMRSGRSLYSTEFLVSRAAFLFLVLAAKSWLKNPLETRGTLVGTEATAIDLEALEKTMRVKLRVEASGEVMVLQNLTSLMVWISWRFVIHFSR